MGANASALACRTVRQRRLTSSARPGRSRKKRPTCSRTWAADPKQVLAVTSSRTQPQMASSALKSGL